MFNKTAVALAAASLVLGAAAVSPASANYDRCYETPSAKGCPGNYDVTQEPFYVAPSKSAEHEMHPAHHHHPPPSRLVVTFCEWRLAGASLPTFLARLL